MRARIYIDTSVIGGCYDVEFFDWSTRLFDEFRKGLKIALISDLTYWELQEAPQKVRKVLETLSADQFEALEFSNATGGAR